MKITALTVYQVDLPLEHPYWLSGGRLKFDCLDATFVRVDTDAGITGWGEGTPWGHTYVPAHGPGIRAGIDTMAPFILGLDPRLLLRRMVKAVRWFTTIAGSEGRPPRHGAMVPPATTTRTATH